MSQVYQIERAICSTVEVFSLREGDRASAQVACELGNNCFSFRVREPVLEMVSFEEFLERPTSYGIPLLFPFPNRLRDGRFRFRGQSYSINPPRHGLVRDKAWKVLEAGASNQQGAWVRSAIDASDYPDQMLRQFPFPFRLEVTWRLKDGRLEMEAVAQNTGQEDMPAGFGIHPYFRRPVRGRLLVPAHKRWELVDSLPTGNLLDVEGSYDLRNGADIAGLQLDDIFTDVIADSDDIARCRLDDLENLLRTEIEFKASEFPDVVVYTPPAPRAALCLEPNTCPTDAFNLHDRGIASNVIVLGAGHQVRFKISIGERRIAG
jgi:aldose 1-epimerase